MKKFYFLFTLLLSVLVANAATIPAGTKLYLTPNSNWKIDNARFAAYFFGSNGDIWTDMTYVKDSILYSFVIRPVIPIYLL